MRCNCEHKGPTRRGCPVFVDSEWINPLRALIRRYSQNPMAWLGALILANLAFIGVGFTFQRADGAPAEAEGTPATDLPGLRLVSEMSLEAPVQPVVPLSCRIWGPFNDPEALLEIQGLIEKAGGATQVHQTPVFNEPDYLVYVGQRGKAENARRVLEELKSQSIESALITRGPYNNTLSVGVFSRPARAEVQRQRVATLGYEVGIEEIDRSYQTYQLEARVPAGFEIPYGPGEACAEIAQAH